MNSNCLANGFGCLLFAGMHWWCYYSLEVPIATALVALLCRAYEIIIVCVIYWSSGCCPSMSCVYNKCYTAVRHVL